MSVYLMTGLAIMFGGALILGALYLLYTKRISLEQVLKSKSLEGEAIKVEIESLVKVSSNVPALGLFLVGLVLIISGLYYTDEEGKRRAEDTQRQLNITSADLEKARKELLKQRTRLRIEGTISTIDQNFPGGIEVQERWPAFRTDSNGKLNGLTVQRQSDGSLPVLAFSHPNYSAVTLDLNDETKIEESRVVIPIGKVVLNKLPGKGGTQ